MMRRTIVVGALVALFCSTLPGQGFAATSEEIQERALEAMEAGHYTKAVGLWQQVLDMHPGQPGALYNLACCHSRTGEMDLAAMRLEEAFDAGLRDPGLLQSDPDLEALRETRKGRELIDRLVFEARSRGVPGYFEAPVLGGIRVVVPQAMEKDRMYPLVMVLHGHGGNPENYVGMFERAGSSLDAIVGAPYGPYPIPFDKGHGYSWYPAPWFFQEVLRAGASTGDLAQRRSEIDLQEQMVSRNYVLAAIDHVAGELPIDRDRIFLMGHSEGGVLAYGLALGHPDLFRGLIVVGARLRESDTTPEILTTASGKLDVMICHSPGDEAIGFDNARAAAKILKGAGIQNKVYSYEGGHGFTTELIHAIGRWITARSRD